MTTTPDRKPLAFSFPLLLVGTALAMALLVVPSGAAIGPPKYCDQSAVNYAVGLVNSDVDKCGPCRPGQTHRIWIHIGVNEYTVGNIYYPYCQGHGPVFVPLPPPTPEAPDPESDGGEGPQG